MSLRWRVVYWATSVGALFWACVLAFACVACWRLFCWVLAFLCGAGGGGGVCCVALRGDNGVVAAPVSVAVLV